MMNQRNTRLLRTAAVLVGLLGVLTMSASAMHIAEGYLPVGWAAGWGVVCVPFVVAGFLSIQKKVAQAPKAKSAGHVRSVRLRALRAENPLL